MICLEREVSPAHFYLSMRLIGLRLPIIDKHIGFNVHRPFNFHLFRHIHLPHFSLKGGGIREEEEDKKGAQNEPVISHDSFLGKK